MNKKAFFCFRGRNTAMELPRTTSIEDTIEAWVDEVHKTTDTSDAEIDDYNISWKKVSIKHHPTTYDTAAQILLQETSMPTKSPSVQVLCQSSFENKTDRKQIKLFHATQSTRSIANFQMDNNVQFAPGFKFTPPGGIIKATKMAEINMGNNTFSEEVTWEVNNSIHVGPHKKVVCQLAVEKYINQGRFTHMVDLVGEISVLAKLSDGSMRFFYGDVRTIFKSLLNGEVLDDCVRLKVTGQARFHFSIRQRVLVNEQDLDITQTSGRKNIPTTIPKSGPPQLILRPKLRQYNPVQNLVPSQPVPHPNPSEPVSPVPLQHPQHTFFPSIPQRKSSVPARPRSSKPVSDIHLPIIQQPCPQPCRRPHRVFRAYRAVGLELANGDFEEVIPKNALLPATGEYNHPTARKYQTKSEFYFYEGNHHVAENNKFLACLALYKEKFELADIVITFRLERDGTLCVTAEDEESGEQDDFEVQLEKVKTYWQ